MEQTNNKDREHLKLLSIFHYIVGGIVGVTFVFPFIVQAGIISLIFSSPEVPESNGTLPPPEFGGIFFITGLVFLLIGLIVTVCLIASGRFLAKRKRYWFSFTIACIECLFTPIGTVLGVFTIIVLSRDSVKALYELKK